MGHGYAEAAHVRARAMKGNGAYAAMDVHIIMMACRTPIWDAPCHPVGRHPVGR